MKTGPLVLKVYKTLVMKINQLDSGSVQRKVSRMQKRSIPNKPFNRKCVGIPFQYMIAVLTMLAGRTDAELATLVLWR